MDGVTMDGVTMVTYWEMMEYYIDIFLYEHLYLWSIGNLGTMLY